MLNRYKMTHMFPEIKRERYDLVPYCTSRRCCIKESTLMHMTGKLKRVKKNVDNSEIFCPDCGYALYRRKEKIY